MKYLLCSQELTSKEQLKEHYKVNPFNHFFFKLFKPANEVYKPRKCLRCQDFLPTTKFKVTYDFLKH